MASARVRLGQMTYEVTNRDPSFDQVSLRDVVSMALDDDSIYIRDVLVGPNGELTVNIGSPSLTVSVAFFEPEDEPTDSLADSFYRSPYYDDRDFCVRCDCFLVTSELDLGLCSDCQWDLELGAFEEDF